MTSPAPAPPAASPGEDSPEPVFATVEEWVRDHFVPVYRRAIGGEYRWCARWWDHPEAVTRLTALWHSWEVLRLQPGTGIAAWLRDHLDHQLGVLMGRSGPFASCTQDEHDQMPPARLADTPPHWWDDPADDAWAGE